MRCNSEPSDSKGQSRIRRRDALKATAGGSAALLAGCTSSFFGGGSEEYPSDTITFIVPYSPGGGYDTYTRLVANHLDVPVDVNVQNVEGAGGIVGTEQMYNSESDGYTLGIAPLNTLARIQLTQDTNFDLNDMTAFPRITRNPSQVGVSSQSDITSWEDFAEAMDNGELRIATVGPLSAQSLNHVVTGEETGLWSLEDVQNNSVAFDGTGAIISALENGDVEALTTSYSSILQFVPDTFRLLALLSNEDSPSDTDLPDPPESTQPLPTLKTLGVENADRIDDLITAQRVFAGPPDIPEDRANYLRDKISETIQENDEFKQAAEDADRPIDYGDSQQTEEMINNNLRSWGDYEDTLNKLADK